MTTTIIDLPEILLNIAIHLTPADLAQACRVSRGWFVPFASQLWRSIQQHQWTDGNLRSALPRYAVFVRELYCHPYLASDALGVQFNQLTLFWAPRLVPNNMETVDQILKHNPDIQDLSLSFALPEECAGWVHGVIQTVGRMTKMKRLSLGELLAAPGDLGSLLDQLPGLESLTLEDCGYIFLPLMESDPADIPADSAKQSKHPQESRQLQSLQMHGNKDCFELIHEIARRSPLLEQLALVNGDLRMSSELRRFALALGSYCQHLDQLAIRGCNMNVAGLAQLLFAFPSLRRFQVMDVPMRHGNVLKFLSQHKSCRESLEEVSVSVGYTQSYLEGSVDVTVSVLTLLQEFPKLRKVYLRQCCIPATKFVAYREFYNSFVASRDLEVLEITFIGPRKSWVPAEVHSEEAHRYWGSSGDDNADETPDHSLYSEIMEAIHRQPRLDASAIRFF